MIIEIPNENSIVKWKNDEKDEWKYAEISDLINAYERPKGEWGKWVISELRCPICLEYFDPDCYSKEELNECPSCGAEMRKGGES